MQQRTYVTKEQIESAFASNDESQVAAIVEDIGDDPDGIERFAEIFLNYAHQGVYPYVRYLRELNDIRGEVQGILTKIIKKHKYDPETSNTFLHYYAHKKGSIIDIGWGEEREVYKKIILPAFQNHAVVYSCLSNITTISSYFGASKTKILKLKAIYG